MIVILGRRSAVDLMMIEEIRDVTTMATEAEMIVVIEVVMITLLNDVMIAEMIENHGEMMFPVEMTVAAGAIEIVETIETEIEDEIHDAHDQESAIAIRDVKKTPMDLPLPITPRIVCTVIRTMRFIDTGLILENSSTE